MYDYRKLRGRIYERYDTMRQFAREMEMSTRTLSLKLNNKCFWKQPEISKASILLGISPEDIQTYFFSLKVQEKCTRVHH